jgi:hypothetical protein
MMSQAGTHQVVVTAKNTCVMHSSLFDGGDNFLHKTLSANPLMALSSSSARRPKCAVCAAAIRGHSLVVAHTHTCPTCHILLCETCKQSSSAMPHAACLAMEAALRVAPPAFAPLRSSETFEPC